jgi:ABC-type molybdate transport system substrate-binding protein
MNPFAECKFLSFTLGFVLLMFALFFAPTAPAQSTIFSENFEGAWPGTWFVGNDGGVSGYTWGDNSVRAYNGSWSGFCADPGGTAGNSASTYPNNLSTYMEKHSVSLVGYNSPQLTFRYYSALASGDALTVYVRDNLGSWSSALKTITGTSSGWQLATVDLSAYQGQAGLYVQIRFDSNASGTSSGIWVDDIALTALPAGALNVTVKDVNGNVFSGAAAVSRYDSSFVYLDSKNTSSGVASWPNVPTGAYNLEAYSNGEFWGAVQATVTQGNTANVTIQRTEPYATSFATKLGSTDVTGGTVPSESNLRHEVTVMNSTAASQSVRVLLRVDQSQSSPFDFEQTSAAQTVSSGGTQTFSFDQTPSVPGTYYRYLEVQTFINSSWVKTDTYDWGVPLTVTAGALNVTVKDVNGNVFTGAAAVSRYDSSFVFLDSKNTSSGVANWPNVPTGTYNLEAYSNGEFWGAVQATVTQGNTANVTIQRTEPYATSFATKLDTTDVTGGTVPSGSNLRHEVTVMNSTAASQSVRVLLRVDQSQSSPFDFEQTSAAQTISSGGTQTFSFDQTPNVPGTYYRYLEVQTLINGSWVKTDTYDWGVPLTVLARQGVDYSFDRPSPKGLQSAGKHFAIRYLGGSKQKNPTGDEAKSLHDYGLDVILVFEGDDKRMLGGYDAGVADATTAVQQGAEAWAPQDFFCYFACDWDAGLSDQSAIESYLDGAASILGKSRVGLYGGYGPVSRALDNGKAAKAWQTDSWLPALKDSRIKLYQYVHNITIAGGNCDLDEGYGNDLGQWTPLTTAKVIALDGALNFGNVAVSTSRMLTLKLANKGNTALNITSITYPTGFSGDWNSGVVAAGAWVNIIITFNPQIPIPHTGFITIDSDATGGINSIAIAGIGVSSPPAIVSVVPSAGVNGTIAPDTTQMVNASGAISFIATPASSGYIVDKWLVNNALAQSGEENFTMTNVTSDSTVQVIFKPLPIPQQLTGATLLDNGFQFTLNGDPGDTYILYTSLDFVTWVPVSTNTIPLTGSTNIVHLTPGLDPARFYRAIVSATGP